MFRIIILMLIVIVFVQRVVIREIRIVVLMLIVVILVHDVVNRKLTEKLYANCADLRIPLNQLEGYLNLSAKDLDIAVKDFRLKGVRADITNGNVEGVIANTQKVLVHVTRNQTVLTAVGMTGNFVAGMETRIAEINNLNLNQNELISKRGRLSDENMTLFNDLWESLQSILKTGRALYKGVNPVKLKDYTMSQLEKRVHRKTASPSSEASSM